MSDSKQKFDSYVAVEAARVFNVDTRRYPVEGQIFGMLPDGTLKRLNGAELIDFSNDYPNFATHWRLDEPE